MPPTGYLMESDEEVIRLDRKTSGTIVEQQALRAGIRPGMRVADLGCGSGKTTFHLHRLSQPGGTALGVDIASQRVEFARSHYGDQPGIDFAIGDIRRSLAHLGLFDFIWIRFVLEYYRSASDRIVENVAASLRPGGILCLVDLDYNCLSHSGLPERLEKALRGIMEKLQDKADFDPYAGRKLYGFLYDLGLQDIEVHMDAHHLIYGNLGEVDEFNWRKKVEVAARNSGFCFSELYHDGFNGFFKEFTIAFAAPRRFTYTPRIACWGRRPETVT